MVQIVIDGTSPVLGYAGSGWLPVSRTLDASHANYSYDTATTTCTTGDAMNFTFFGTNISIYGARRNTHGLYTAGVDNTSTTTDGFSKTGVFQSQLFGSENLSRGSHQLHLANTPNDTAATCVDIDWVEINDDDPPSAAGSLVSLPSDQALQVLPSISTWQNLNGVWQTNDSLASMKFTFTGGSAVLYGRVDVGNGPYMCSIDNTSNFTYTSYAPQSADSQVMCYAGGLDPTKQHTIQLFNSPNATNQRIQLTHALAFQVPQTSSPKLSSQAITWILVDILVLLLTLSIIFAIFLRRRRHRRRAAPSDAEAPPAQDPTSPELGFEKPPPSEINSLPNFPPTPSNFSSEKAPSTAASFSPTAVAHYIRSDPSPESPTTLKPPPSAFLPCMTLPSPSNATYRGSATTIPSSARYAGMQSMIMRIGSKSPKPWAPSTPKGVPKTPRSTTTMTFGRDALDAGLVLTDDGYLVLLKDSEAWMFSASAELVVPPPPAYASRTTTPNAITKESIS
ncbi:hypothetical protein DL93DRAFT_786274 [Clavulina sp. PMI_390]|nr:hypothetical protein DL93DRAFT_786274 [Clavulina sp. PMI_390]